MDKYLYHINIVIRKKDDDYKSIINDIYTNNYNNIKQLINNGIKFINNFIIDTNDDIVDNIDEFEYLYDLQFKILVVNQYKKQFLNDKDRRKAIYDKYIDTNDLFKSFLEVDNALLYINYNGIIEDCKWQGPIDINYIPIELLDIHVNEYKYNKGDIVQYLGGVYYIIGHSKDFIPEDILNSYSIDIYHSYSMEGIRDGYYDHIRADDKAHEGVLSLEISDSNKYLIPFIEGMNNIVQSSVDADGIVDDDLVNRKFHYWLATDDIKYDLK